MDSDMSGFIGYGLGIVTVLAVQLYRKKEMMKNRRFSAWNWGLAAFVSLYAGFLVYWVYMGIWEGQPKAGVVGLFIFGAIGVAMVAIAQLVFNKLAGRKMIHNATKEGQA